MGSFLEFLTSANLVQIFIGGVIGYAFKSGNKKLIGISIAVILAVVGIDYYNKNLKPCITFDAPQKFDCEAGLQWGDLAQWEAELNPDYCDFSESTYRVQGKISGVPRDAKLRAWVIFPDVIGVDPLPSDGTGLFPIWDDGHFDARFCIPNKMQNRQLLFEVEKENKKKVISCVVTVFGSGGAAPSNVADASLGGSQ